MSTITFDPTPPIGPSPAVDPRAAVARARPRTSVTETISQTLSMAWRALKKMRRNPEQFFDVTLQPLLFTAMFAYIFGGAISGNVNSYLPLMIPGIVAQTVLTTCMSTGVQLREDMEKGVFDRFKTLPIARIAPLAGPMVADMVRYLIAASLTFVMGMIIGYRPGGGPLGRVRTGTNALDMNVSGNRINIENPWTLWALRAIVPRKVKIQAIAQPVKTASTIAARTPSGPPAGR